MGNCGLCVSKDPNNLEIEVTANKPKEAEQAAPIDEVALIQVQSALRTYLAKKAVKKMWDDYFSLPEPEECLAVLHATVKEQRATNPPFEFGNKKNPALTVKAAVETPQGKYVGEWNSQDEIEGRGRYYYNDGSLSEGFWHDGLLHGKGTYFSSTGFVYMGDWVSGKKHGQGKLVSPDMTYEGTFFEDAREGKGKETWQTGMLYEGEFKDNNKNGQGKLKWADGSTYEGQFKDNHLDGFGHYKWVDGKEYIGTWRASKMHGRGKFTWPDGKYYEGDYVDDRKEGKGKMGFTDGRIYDGDWLDGKQHGEGFLIVPGKEPRKALWENGKPKKSSSKKK